MDGYLHTKEMEPCKYLNLKDHDDYKQYMNLPESLQSDFIWWLNKIDNSVNNMKTDYYKVKIFSDASTTGWGAT